MYFYPKQKTEKVKRVAFCVKIILQFCCSSVGVFSQLVKRIAQTKKFS